jgi:predicted aminopeptidase
VAGLANDITVRRRGEENIYSEIDDVRKKLEEAICRSLDKKEFIDFKSEVTEALAGRVEMEVMQTALEEITADTNARLATDKRETEELFRALLKRTEDRLEEANASSLA